MDTKTFVPEITTETSVPSDVAITNTKSSGGSDPQGPKPEAVAANVIK